MTMASGTAPGVPAVYDDVSMTFAPVTLYQAGEAIATDVNGVVDALSSIMNTLSSLRLGWAGATAAEAQQIGDAWTACMTNLFGTGETNTGVLGQLITVLLTAASNYDAAEVSNTAMFTQLAGGLTGGGGNPVGAASDPVTDPSVSSVGEIGFSYLNDTPQ